MPIACWCSNVDGQCDVQAKKLAVERDANTLGYEEGVPPVSLVAGAAGVKETEYNADADIHSNGGPNSNGHANGTKA